MSVRIDDGGRAGSRPAGLPQDFSCREVDARRQAVVVAVAAKDGVAHQDESAMLVLKPVAAARGGGGQLPPSTVDGKPSGIPGTWRAIDL